MNNRKYQTNPSDLLAQGQAIMSSSDESKYLFRVYFEKHVDFYENLSYINFEQF